MSVGGQVVLLHIREVVSLQPLGMSWMSGRGAREEVILGGTSGPEKMHAVAVSLRQTAEPVIGG